MYICYCVAVSCEVLIDPENGIVTCFLNETVFQDTCIYHCNRGYQLEGDRQTRCNADGTWSSEPVTCTILKCNDPDLEITNSKSSSACNVTYGSSCSLSCLSGFKPKDSDNGKLICDVDDEGTSVKWKVVGGTFSCVDDEKSNTQNKSGSGSLIPIIAGAVGGIVLLCFIVVLCFVLVYWKQSKIKKYHVSTAYSHADTDSNKGMYSYTHY